MIWQEPIFVKESRQPTWKLWGEEREEGAVYTIYLKKVRYQNPTKTLLLESDDERSHLEWETIRVKFIKAGTIEKLVNSLASDDGELESTFVNIFLATYRTFASPHHVLSLLIERYEYLVNNKEALSESMIDPHKKTVVSALHVWLDSYPEDFRDPPLHTCLRCLHSFTFTYLPKTELHIKATYRLERFLKECKQSDTTTFISDDYDLVIANSPHSPYNFPNIAERHFAEQLTRMDRDVLRSMVAHQCLGAVWSKNKRAGSAPTVLATIDQFNAVSLRVISTVILAINSERPHVIETWIDIAQELRVLKNFSSLKAIISGLQSNSVFRLKKTWHSVPRDKVELFQELARIFSEENNQWAQRKLLIREGTAKFADTFGHNDRHLQKIIQKQQSTMSKLNIGTIPYLGTFLTDLTMIDAATPDLLPDGLINFDKKRKEFEVLAQIKLLQGAANSYNITEDSVFDQWFHSILVLDDREAFRISCQIEPSDNITSSCANSIIGTGKKQNYEHKKNDSISSNCSSKSLYGLSDDGLHSPNNSLDKQDSLLDLSSSSSSYSLQSFDMSLNGSNNTNIIVKNSVNNSTFNTSSDFYIIRITVDADNVETDGVVLYKSIMLSNNERTPQVIRNAMLKFCIDDDPENYTLSQVLPDKEMILPMTANVYYAVNTEYDLNFLLRKKTWKNNTIPKK
ncbi:ral guanine nucleotide dissociation stimulator-like 1 isoform X3 [Rhopalosiphum maidis]|uniref:ral guanine nucleotide dissociation stimulator-like 1 isoform X3 n=1 Tax=Rhopalosiphum maidis TaxID=43146 RepID=UPI000F00D1FD|nr:ral guanine nucleotide dissociation stimulator-like 1 isoform X3 [Rhopalosiphum maidis]